MQEESTFKVLYRCNRTIERHTNSPLADSRRQYLEHLAAGGANLARNPPPSGRLPLMAPGRPHAETANDESIAPEAPGRKFTWDETVAVLRKGTQSEDEAKRWSEGTGIPAHVFLAGEQFERRNAYDE